MILSIVIDAGYLVALGFDFSIGVDHLGDHERARAIGRELLEVTFERLTHPYAEGIPVRVLLEDGPGAEEWTVTLKGESEDVEAVRREVLRVAGIRDGR